MKEIEIPEGYEARIDGNKVIILPKESESERIRKILIGYFTRKNEYRDVDELWEGLEIPDILAWLEKQKAKERLDRMAPIYNNKESFESALEKAWKYYNESASRTVDSFEDDYIECVFSKGFREGFLYREKQKEQKPVGWKPEPESLEALMYAIEGKWEMIKPTSYLSRRLEDLYEGLVNTFNVDESLVVELTKTAYSAKDIEEIKVLKRKIDESMETKPAEHLDDKVDEDVELTPFESALFSAFSDAWQEYMLGETVNVAHWAKEHSEELLEVVKEESAEWSEEDEKMLDKCKHFIAIAPVGWNMEEGQKAYDCGQWLKSLPSRFNLQPTKQEWSSEDERMLNVAIRSCEQTIEDYPNERVRFKDCISWLKSIHPQPHWKPSEEQESVAERFAKIVRGNLTGISKEVQKQFEQLYFEITNEKMYGGYND